VVIGGNERVVRPRLADAQFFFDQDRKKTLASRVDGLAQGGVPQQARQPGPSADGARARHCRPLSRNSSADAAWSPASTRPRDLAKTDLLTDMVGEFPSCRAPWAPTTRAMTAWATTIAHARLRTITSRVLPGMPCRATAAGLVVALADKLETLVGMFGIGNLPTGDKDPFALRRHALGVIRMLVERDLPLALPDALQLQAGWRLSCLAGRLALRPQPSWLEFHVRPPGRRAARAGLSARRRSMRCWRCGRSGWATCRKRLAAVRAFAELPESAGAGGGQQAHRQYSRKGRLRSTPTSAWCCSRSRLKSAFYAAMQETLPQAQAQWQDGDYADSLQALAALRAPVDAFFDDVMVNADAAGPAAEPAGPAQEPASRP